MQVEEIITNLKSQIVAQLNLEEVKPESIDPNAPLFGDGLGLDSIDALELIVLLEKEYNVKIKDPKDAKAVFASVRTMAEYIAQHSK